MAGYEWRRVKDLLADALEQRADTRAAFLDRACDGDAALRAELDALLAAEGDAGAFIETPAFTVDPPAAATDPLIGSRLGAYVIEQLIGRGGMGAVYLARRADAEFEQQVAVKTLRSGLDSDLLVRRFRHERQILASLDHPHIARLFDGGTTAEGLPYFVMEHVNGAPIDRYADEQRLSTRDRVRVMLKVVDAVQHAHDKQIVHRDLKPGNVLVTTDGQPKLLDFGIAKIVDGAAGAMSTLTSFGRPMTPDYASPEQVRGEDVTPSSDVYALGLLLYELLTGHRPYRLAAHTPDEMARVVCEQDPERPSVVVQRSETVTSHDGTTSVVTPEAVGHSRDASPAVLHRLLSGTLDDIVLKSLRKDPARRYASAADLGADLRRYLDGAPVRARNGLLRYRVGRFVARHRTAIAASLLVAATVGLTAATLRRAMPASAPTAPTAAAPAVAAPRPSVAVLRFRNLSARPADAWLATALAEMLTTELGGGGQLRLVPAEVVARAERDGRSEGAEGQGGDEDRLRQALGATYVAVGAFTVGTAPARTIRVDIRLASATEPRIAVAETGSDADLFALVSTVGQALRRRLGIDDPTPEASRGIRAAMPRNTEAARLYAEGLERLRELDAVTAQALLERAATAEGNNPLIHSALAAAWTALGYDAKAAAAAARAFDVSAALTREDRLAVEGRLFEARKDWPKAVEVYRTLWGFFADNAEYGLRLAAALTSSGKAKDALGIVGELRALKAAGDPRVDLAEATAASALGDFPRELTAARQAMATAQAVGARQLLARAELAAGRSLYNQGQKAEADRVIAAARATFAAVGDRAGEAQALNSLGSLADDRGESVTAERLYQASYALGSAVGDRRGMSTALNNLGILLKDAGRLAEARETHERALALRREVGDRNWTAVSLNNIGVVLFEQDRLAEAADYYEQALALSREVADKRNEVRALHNLAVVRREAGDLAEARTTYEQAIPARAAINDRRGGVIARVELGMVLLAQGELEAARRHTDDARVMSREVDMAEGESQALFQLGEIALAGGDIAAARRAHQEALAMRRKAQQTRTVLESQVAMARLSLVDGQVAEAARLADETLRAGKEQVPIRLQALLLLVETRLATGDVTAAARAARDARALAAESQRMLIRWALDMADARVALARGQTAPAARRLAALRRDVAAKGMVLAELETRLLECEVLRAAAAPEARRAAESLIADARARGAELIRRQAAAAAGIS